MEQINIFFPGWGLSYYFYKPLFGKIKNRTVFIDFNFFDYPDGFRKTDNNILISPLKYLPALTENTIANIISHSLGTLYAIDYIYEIITYPNGKLSNITIKSFTVISGFARFVSDEEKGIPGQPESVLVAMKKELKKDTKRLLRSFYRNMLYPEKKTPIELLSNPNINQLTNGLNVLLRSDKTNLLQDIEIPVNIIHGTKDKIVPFESAKFLLNKLTSAHLTVIEEGGHALPLSHSDICAATILSL